jgi:hypothetical protein
VKPEQKSHSPDKYVISVQVEQQDHQADDHGGRDQPQQEQPVLAHAPASQG